MATPGFDTASQQQVLSMQFTPLCRAGAPVPEALGDLGGSDTSDDDADAAADLAHSSSNRMLCELGVRTHPAAGGSALAQEAFKTTPKHVKKAIAEHARAAQGSAADAEARAGPRKVTRVVKTCKQESVMGEGLVASEEKSALADAGAGAEAEGPAQRAHSPLVGDIGNLRRFIRDRSERQDAVEPRDVPLREAASDARRQPPAAYKPPLMGIDASFVPPELAARGVGAAVWECFADALNAAIPRGTQEVENQIARWNADAFDDLGFGIGLVSLDFGLSLSVAEK
ncbi:hypothetical protein GGI00_002713 [Coemansia sp. RSA 2681]|nr:hypothetical protein GGI00_002713 [Coemansia sp. RSA 2681]KAJ2441661.1 hypothetical protein GGF42_007222 [Coemansia sp. RSA 2424]